MKAVIENASGGTDITVIGDRTLDRISFRSPAIDASPNALIPLGLLPSMFERSALVLEQPVSPRLWNAVDELQAVFAAWHKVLPVSVSSPGTSRLTPPDGRGAACFFSCGVDSFFSALELAPVLDALILVRGFDFGFGREDEPDQNQIVAEARFAASELGLDLVLVTTDLRRWSDRHVLWGDHYVGSGLAVVAHLLWKRFGRVYVPATHAGTDAFPYGTHPLTDPMWGSEDVEICVHGAETRRPDKVGRIASSDVAMRTLRVCWENRGGAYNCGRCSKCVRTMVELWAVGGLERCATLPDSVDPKLVADAMLADDPSSIAFARQLLSAIGNHPSPEAAALRCALGSVLP